MASIAITSASVSLDFRVANFHWKNCNCYCGQ